MSKGFSTTLLVTYLFFIQSITQNVFADAKLKDPVKELIKKMDDAVHSEKLKDTKSMVVKANIDIPDAKISGTSEATSTSNKAYIKISMSGSDQEMGYDGKIAWGKDITQGTRELNGQEKESVIQSTITVLKDIKAYYTEITQEKDEKFQEKDCLVLILKKEGIPDRKMYVDKTTFLPSGMSEESDTPQGKMTIKTIFASYKKLENGFLMADKFIQDMGIMKINFVITETKFDVKIDDKLFNKPE